MNSLTQIISNHYHYGPPLEPVSRTYQYRKIMKPMLERKRRARINKCLDELKDLMTGTLQTQENSSENMSKLEKADILEMTVRHLQQLREKKSLYLYNHNSVQTQKFWDGFQRCAAEVAQFLHKHQQNINSDLLLYFSTINKTNSQQFASAAVIKPLATAQKQFPQQISCLNSAQQNFETSHGLHIEHDDHVWRPW